MNLLGNFFNIKRSLYKRIEQFKKALSENQVLEEFDREVFESIVEKVIIGGVDDEGNKDPYKITFIYKTGFKDSIDNAKAKFDTKKNSTKLCSNNILKSGNLCCNNSDNRWRWYGI